MTVPEELQRDVAVRVATMDRTSPDIIASVETSLEKRLSSVLQQGDLSSVGGVQTLVDLLMIQQRFGMGEQSARPDASNPGRSPATSA
jgi:flagellar motor switch protein FliG